MIKLEELKVVLYEALQLEPSHIQLNENTALLGAIPEFDSMAVLSVLTELEERFELVFEDEDLSGEVFNTVGTLLKFINKA
ncbi:MAG: acyl carrier protein [Gammaproteobacteria bacterium]|nr:acyl carrier protein [Gammaproteobacteria bacterium]